MSKLPKQSKLEIINYYKRWADGDDDNELDRYPNEDLMNVRLPFRALVCGPSNTGKTNVVLNLFSLIGIWDKVVILAKDLEEKLYKRAIKEIQTMETLQKRKILLAIDSIELLPPISSFKKEENSLLIVDDFVADDPKSLIPLDHIWIRGRKQRISPIFITQSYFDTPKNIRKNSDYVFFKALGNPNDASRIAREYALGASAAQIKEMYESTQETGRDPATEFFLIDRFPREPKLRFRDQFEPMEIPPARSPKKKLISSQSIPAL